MRGPDCAEPHTPPAAARSISGGAATAEQSSTLTAAAGGRIRLAAMPAIEIEAPSPPTIRVEIDYRCVLALRRQAALRDVPIARLVQ